MKTEPLPTGPFSLICADPPWRTESYNGKSLVPTQAEDPYPTMTLEELKAMEVAKVASKDALLAMWTIGSHIDQAIELAEAWGFSFNTDLFYWFKLSNRGAKHDDLFLTPEQQLRIGMGRHTRKQAEPCFLFKRGRGLPVLSHSVRQVITTPPTRHSAKPAESFEGLHQLYGDVPRLELFARQPREGWTVWGNEVATND